MQGFNVGTAVTGAVVSGTGNTTITLFSEVEHQFNSIKEVNIIDGGSGYNNRTGIATVIYAADFVNNALIGRGAAVSSDLRCWYCFQCQDYRWWLYLWCR